MSYSDFFLWYFVSLLLFISTVKDIDSGDVSVGKLMNPCMGEILIFPTVSVANGSLRGSQYNSAMLIVYIVYLRNHGCCCLKTPPVWGNHGCCNLMICPPLPCPLRRATQQEILNKEIKGRIEYYLYCVTVHLHFGRQQGMKLTQV